MSPGAPSRPGSIGSPRPQHLALALAATALAVAMLAACSDPESADRARVGPAVATTPGAPPGADTTVLCVDTSRSLVRWQGTEVAGGGHAGVLRFGGGRLRLDGGRVVGGAVNVDMRTIAITDIPAHETEARRRLRSHLAHEEFFAVDRFATARLVLTGVEPGEHGLYTVSGNLAIRDSVHNVTFEATAPVATRAEVWASADFGISRRLWGVEFDGRTSALRNAIVHDLIRLEVTLVATRGACGTEAEPA